MDMTTISSLTTAGGTAISLLRGLSAAVQTMDKAKMGSIIIELQQAMMDIQQKQQLLIEENNRLRDDNRA